jgi:hypothetical protein
MPARRHHRGRPHTAAPARPGSSAPAGRPPARADTAGHCGHRRGRQGRDPGLVRRGDGRDRRRHGRRRGPAGRTARRSVRAEHALVVAGPVHETYLVGPRDTDERTAWRTEIGWPVFSTTPGASERAP